MKQRGFSLLEVLVAVTIIGIGFSIAFAGMSGSIRGLQRVDDAQRRIELARYKLAELDLVKRIRPNDSANGMFDDGTRWTLQSTPYIAPVATAERPNPAMLILVDLILEWKGRAGMQKRVIQTYRFQVDDNVPIASLDEQLHAIQ